ncbi:MAG: HAMP domain-containing histidine kinase [Clostridia bacterium]|nr:HAMP domain-containing histidine kinase [Clostridia bacterium]
MFKSVFAKYLTAICILILACFLILAWIISSVVRNYAVELKRNEMNWSCSTTVSLVSLTYGNSDGSSSFSDFILSNKSKLADIIGTVLERDESVTVLLTDSAGFVLLVCGDREILTQEAVPQSIVSSIAEENEYMDRGNVGGSVERDYLTYARPIFTEDGSFEGTAILLSSADEERTLIKTLTETIVMSSLWVLLAAMIAVYFITDRVVDPLRGMTSAVKRFGKGDFKMRVPINGRDEIADLGAAFNHMAESLEHTEKMRNMFLANVSHDLRTPMTTISGFIDGINSGAIPPEKHGYYLNVISGEVHRLSRLVSELLDLSKLESGERKFNATPFDVCETARLILISFEQKINEKRLDVEFLSDEDSITVVADRDAIYQVLYNLVDNAIKFARDGGILRVEIRRKPGGKATVSVFNEGEGIPEADLPYVFDRFYKSDKSRGLDKNGVGLGLYIVKTILEAQGETISVESNPGENCEFVFTLTERTGE